LAKAKEVAAAKKVSQEKAAALEAAHKAKEAKDAEVATATIELEDATLDLTNATDELTRVMALTSSTQSEKDAALAAKNTATTTKATKTTSLATVNGQVQAVVTAETDAQTAYDTEFAKEKELIDQETTKEAEYIDDMQELTIFEDEIIIIDESYIEIFATEEAARTFVEVVENEEKEVKKEVTRTTKEFKEKTTIVEKAVEECDKAIMNSNNKDKEVFDEETIEAKETMLVAARKKTEQLAAENLANEKKAFNDQKDLKNAK